MKIKSAVMLAATIAISTASFAQTRTDTGLSYNQVGVGYFSMTTTSSGKDYTFSGLGLGGSVLAGKNLLLSASTISVNGDVSGKNVTVSETDIGIGARAGIAAQTDVFGKIYFIDGKGEATGFNYTDTGYGVTVGVKTLIAPSVTGSVFAGQSKMSKSDSSSSFGFGLDYNLSPTMIVGGSYVSGKDTRQFGVTLSYAF
jgi:hypothetical protein